MSDMYSTVAWAKTAADSKFSKIDIQRNVIGDHDVSFDLKYCGICHTDVHIANNDMGNTKVHTINILILTVLTLSVPVCAWPRVSWGGHCSG